MVEAKRSDLGLEKVNIMGVNVAVADEERVLEAIRKHMDKKFSGKPFFIVTVNQEFVMQAQEDSEFKRILNGADLAIADGWGLRLADRRLSIVPGRKIVQRLVIDGSYRIFYLGGRREAAKMMAEMHKGEWDEGAENIKFEILHLKSISNDKIIKKINDYSPDILFVAYGAPWQEKWIWKNRERINARVVMGVGGAFDYLTGKAKLPPDWISGAGLEWLWRLIHEPWRWRRQVNLVRFVWYVYFRQ